MSYLEPPSSSGPVPKLLRYFLISLFVFAGLLSLTMFGLYQAAQREPEFYHQALLIKSEDSQAAGRQLEQSVFDLHNDVRQEGTWEAVFTEEQVNGWLEADLPNKLPNLLPRGTQEPRVSISPDGIRMACQFDNGKFRSIISLALDVGLTDETNTLAVRVSKLRAGSLPVPLKQFLDRIAAQAKRGNVSLRWRQVDSDPVALISIPVTHEDYAHREIYVDSIELRDGAVYLAGHTERIAPAMLHATAQAVPNETIQR